MNIRQHIIHKRKSLTLFEQEQASHLIFEKIKNLKFFKESYNIGFYQAFQGEISCKPLIEYSWKANKKIFLPILVKEKLEFVHYQLNQPLIKNRYGIDEPFSNAQDIFPSKDLDLVLVPLVAFDIKKNRLGMGKGYYDKTFSFLNSTSRPNRPFLAGLAYEFQKIESIDPQSWDISLNVVITKKNIYE